MIPTTGPYAGSPTTPDGIDPATFIALQAQRISDLSQLLRGMARRYAALRRRYNGDSIDPWENPDYCDNASAASPCGPALRVSGLCVECLHEENRKLREALITAEGINALPVDDQVVERIARKLHETSEMRLYTWDSQRHGQWHDVMRERAREVLAVAAPETGDPAAERDALVQKVNTLNAQLSQARGIFSVTQRSLDDVCEENDQLRAAAATPAPQPDDDALRVDRLVQQIMDDRDPTFVIQVHDEIRAALIRRGVGRTDPSAICSATPAPPVDGAALLARCDELDAKDRGQTWIDVAEVRALLTGQARPIAASTTTATIASPTISHGPAFTQ